MAAAATSEIAPGLFRLELGPDGFVNGYLFDVEGELTLFDAGFPTSADEVLAAVESLGRRADAIGRIVVSHAHVDHLGCAAALRERLGVPVLMSEVDAGLVGRGFGSRGLGLRPGVEPSILARPGGEERLARLRAFAAPTPIEPFAVDGHVEPGGEVPGVPDTELIATPGHCAGQLSLLWHRHGGVLLAADAAANVDEGLDRPVVAEDHELAHASFARLVEREFAIAAFGHGPPIVGGAAAAFRARLDALA